MPIQGLTQAQIDAATQTIVDAGGKSTDRANRLPGETATEANARITQAYKDQPKPALTKEGASAGATIEFVRSGAGGVGTYREVYPVGAAIPVERSTEYGNTYDAQGNIISGTGLKPGLPVINTASTVGKTSEQIAAYNSARELAQSFVDAYGGKLSDYFDSTTGRVTSPSKATITTALNNPAFSQVAENPNPVVPIPTAIPGASGNSTIDSGITLASNTFKNTLALFFGASEVEKPWVSELYKLSSSYYKSGSTMDEALNLALQEGRTNPNLKEFAARFEGIFKLQDKLISGVAVTVPTIAEFVKSEAAMGDVLNSAGLGSLNNQKFLGERIGDGLNVSEFTKRINNVFSAIDSLPQQAKDTINRYLPSTDKASLAKAILTGAAGADELSKNVKSYQVLSAAEQQGLGTLTTAGQAGLQGGVNLTQAADLAAMGYDFNTANSAFSQVAYDAANFEKILEINSGRDVQRGTAVQGLIQADIKKLASAERAKADAIALEIGRYSGRSGLAGSKSLSGQRANQGAI
jgi:hypothetical protein